MYIVKYHGTFGFIKPSFAFRDELTFSQQFITKPTLIGMEFNVLKHDGYECSKDCKYIIRHKLNNKGFSIQQENILSEIIKFSKNGEVKHGGVGIIKRGLLLYPELYLGFNDLEIAKKFYNYMIRLSRKEDLMIPVKFFECDDEYFDSIPGVESFDNEEGFLSGFNRYDNNSPVKTILKFNA